MQLLPDRDSGKTLAIGLALLTLAIIYLVCFHWFVVKHLDYSDHISELRNDVGRFMAATGQRDEIEAQLAVVNDQGQNENYFLTGQSFDSAAALLTQRLKQIITTQADHEQDCQVISNQNVRAREAERFEKVLVKVRMRCNLGDLVKVLHELEGSFPLVFIDGMNIYQRYVNVPGRTARNQNIAVLDIRFDMYGYLAAPVVEPRA